MIGEIGGTDEQEAAEYVKANLTKPVVGFIAGQTAPGAPHGPCGRHHQRLGRNGGGEDEGIRVGRYLGGEAPRRHRRAPAEAPVKLADFLSPERVLVPLRAASLEEAILELARACVADGKVSDAAELEALIRTAWEDTTVVLGPTACLPHFRTRLVSAIVAAVGVAPAPLAGLGAETRIVLLVMAPPREAAMYLQTVAAFARTLALPGTAEEFLAAPNAAACWRFRC